MLGRAKGSRAEIDIAKKLKAWWSTFEQAEFVRTPLSGGWGGKDLRSGFRASGDVMTTSVKFPFTVEVKRREGWAWRTLIDGKASPVWGYWGQSVGQAKEMGGIPLLFFRRNREEWSLMLPHVALMLSRTKYVADDVVACWMAGGLVSGADRSHGVHPIVIKAETFFKGEPKAWLGVKLTFPRK